MHNVDAFLPDQCPEVPYVPQALEEIPSAYGELAESRTGGGRERVGNNTHGMTQFHLPVRKSGGKCLGAGDFELGQNVKDMHRIARALCFERCGTQSTKG
jgi:hypothetical protein